MNPSLASAPTSRGATYPQVATPELAIIGEMLASLDSLTLAGRHHLMTKIATFVQARSAAPAGRPAPDRARVAELVERVKREAARPLPFVPSFTEAVQSLLAVPGLFL